MEAEKDKRSLRFDDVSMERSKSFVTALQNTVRTEKSYTHSEQKQMVLDNLKGYAVRALVNAIDHLGTVAYKLGDVLEQQPLDISSMELKVTCLNQKLLTCQMYMEKEGLRQQQLLAIIPRHHKHYTLPNSKKVQFGPHIQAKCRPYSSGASSSKTLSWHLASKDSQTNEKTSPAVNFLNIDEKAWMKSSPASSAAMQTLAAVQRDAFEGSKPLTPYRSFDNLAQREIICPLVRSRSVLSTFFVKQKTPRLRTGA